MKKLILTFFVAFALYACGGKQTDEQTLTAEEENQFVDDATEELNLRVDELSAQADSLNNAIDSLLNTL